MRSFSNLSLSSGGLEPSGYVVTLTDMPRHSLNKFVSDPGANLDTLGSVDGLHLIEFINVRKSHIGSVAKPH
jgi:hypothetical protein